MRFGFSLNKISQFRQELMGFSAILILICHSVGNGVSMPGPVLTLLNFGNIGVDMFLFLSGMGMFYSLQSHRGGVMSWYLRRYRRILVPYLIIAIPYYLFKVLIADSGVLDALYDLSTISYWTHHRSAWFIALLLPLYAVTPIVAKFIDSFKYRWVPTLVLCVACITFSTIFISFDSQVLVNIANAVRRVPGFFVGYWMGRAIMEKNDVRSWLFLTLPIVLVGVFIVVPFKVYYFWLMIFPLFYGLIWIFEHGVKWFLGLCSFLGTITLESYLTNGYIAGVLKHIDWTIRGININPGNYTFYSCVLIFGLLWAIVAHKCSGMIINMKGIGLVKNS